MLLGTCNKMHIFENECNGDIIKKQKVFFHRYYGIFFILKICKCIIIILTNDEIGVNMKLKRS